MCSTYFWCSMRFHKCVSACISVYYVFLVQYALDPGFTIHTPPKNSFPVDRPPILHNCAFFLSPSSFHLATAIALLSAPFITSLL